MSALALLLVLTWSTPADSATLRSSNGVTAQVAGRALSAFKCLINGLEQIGYPIRALGGYRRHGSVRGSLHPAGLALDVNQLRRNVTRPRMPRNEIALAKHCGLISGAAWRNGDSGHFQLGGYGGRRHHRRGRPHPRR